MMAPKISCAPAAPGVALAMATMGATDANVTPIMTGSLMPNHCVAPSDWMSVTKTAAEQVGRNQHGHLLRAGA
jgi:hypothetical protein